MSRGNAKCGRYLLLDSSVALRLPGTYRLKLIIANEIVPVIVDGTRETWTRGPAE